MDIFIQFVFSGLTIGSMYALTALGIVLIYNATSLINFAQGDFTMLAGLAAASLVAAGTPLIAAVGIAIVPPILVALLLQRFSSYIVRRSTMLEVIIMTVAVALVVQGIAQVYWGKELYTVPHFSGDRPLTLGSATILPQALWVLGISTALLVAVACFFSMTVMGKAILAAAHNPSVAQMMGINVEATRIFCFVLSAVLGALAGIATAPITFAIYDSGLMIGLKGIVAALIGGIGSGVGAVIGGLLLGLCEAMTAGYISSQYKDAVPLVIMLLLFMVLPHGIMGGSRSERV